MSTTSGRRPLLVKSSTPSAQNPKLRRRRILLITLMSIICIILIATAVIILYLHNLWPFNESIESRAGLYGKYPVWGGNIKNQQISLNSVITKDNINQIQSLCIYNGSETDISLTGYITVDNNNNAYFGDTSGFIKCTNLDKCQTIWSVLINDILDYKGNGYHTVLNTASLYKTSDGKESVVFGTRGPTLYDCYAIALDINDGSLIWKILLGGDTYSTKCRVHGFMIDEQFAYGGMASHSVGLSPNIDHMFAGRINKINIDDGEIVNQWFSFPRYNDSIDYETEGYYSGGSIWPFPALIDEYVVFGAGNLFTFPRRVQQCMLGNVTSIPIEDVYEYNLCEEDMRENHLNWRCLEKNVYTDSLVILNKNSFELQAAIPLAGVDAWHIFCAYGYIVNQTAFYQNRNCPKRKPPDAFADFTAVGPDIDPVGIATYHNASGQGFAAIAQKSGQFYVVEIPSGNVKIIKKVGPWSNDGGLSPFNMAVDENNMIGIVSIIGSIGTGYLLQGMDYRYKMADNTTICGAGSVYAIDLNTGYTIWEWKNPYSIYMTCNDTKYDEYVDITVDGTCERAFDGTDMLSPQQTVKNVVTSPIDNIIIPLDIEYRGRIVGPLTISNEMVFISTMSGDIFIHDIITGDYIDRLQCPDYQINETSWNRAGIRSGITVYDDRIIFYCGASAGQESTFSAGNQVISMKLSTFHNQSLSYDQY